MTSRAFRTGWKQAAITAIAAYALAAQALLMAFGGALHAGAAHLPQGIICVESGAPLRDHLPSRLPDAVHDGLCCILGCGAAAGAAGTPPAIAVLDRHPPAQVTLGRSREAPFLRLASNVLPVGSRAPPRLG